MKKIFTHILFIVLVLVSILGFIFMIAEPVEGGIFDNAIGFIIKTVLGVAMFMFGLLCIKNL